MGGAQEGACLRLSGDDELVSLTVDVLDLDARISIEHATKLRHVDVHTTLAEGVLMPASRLGEPPDDVERMATLERLIGEETEQREQLALLGRQAT